MFDFNSYGVIPYNDKMLKKLKKDRDKLMGEFTPHHDYRTIEDARNEMSSKFIKSMIPTKVSKIISKPNKSLTVKFTTTLKQQNKKTLDTEFCLYHETKYNDNVYMHVNDTSKIAIEFKDPDEKDTGWVQDQGLYLTADECYGLEMELNASYEHMRNIIKCHSKQLPYERRDLIGCWVDIDFNYNQNIKIKPTEMGNDRDGRKRLMVKIIINNKHSTTLSLAEYSRFTGSIVKIDFMTYPSHLVSQAFKLISINMQIDLMCGLFYIDGNIGLADYGRHHGASARKQMLEEEEFAMQGAIAKAAYQKQMAIEEENVARILKQQKEEQEEMARRAEEGRKIRAKIQLEENRRQAEKLRKEYEEKTGIKMEVGPIPTPEGFKLESLDEPEFENKPLRNYEPETLDVSRAEKISKYMEHDGLSETDAIIKALCVD